MCMNQQTTLVLPDVAEYDVVIENDTAKLKDVTQSKIKEGWQPLGGLTVQGDNFFQAIVKYGHHHHH